MTDGVVSSRFPIAKPLIRRCCNFRYGKEIFGTRCVRKSLSRYRILYRSFVLFGHSCVTERRIQAMKLIQMWLNATDVNRPRLFVKNWTYVSDYILAK